jgi:hypothetical protein
MKTLLPNADWTDEQWGEFRSTLKSILAEQVAEVTFTKVNGDIRVMDCTLDPSVLPQAVVTENKDKPARKTNENSLAVFDTQANGWRSFVIKNIQTVKYN